MWKRDFERVKAGINAVSFLPAFNLCSVLLVYLKAQWRLWYTGSSGIPRIFVYDLPAGYIGKHKLACFIYLCHHPQSHFTMLLLRALFNVGLVTVYIFSLPFHHFEIPSHP